MIYKIAKKMRFGSSRASFLKWVVTHDLRETWMDIFNTLPKDDPTVPCEEDWGESDNEIPGTLIVKLQKVLQAKHPDSIFLVLDTYVVDQGPGELDLSSVYIYQLACGNRIGTGLWVDQPTLPIAKMLHAWEINGTMNAGPEDFLGDFCEALSLGDKYEEFFGESPYDFSADYSTREQERAINKMCWERAIRVLERNRKKHNYVVDPQINDVKFDGEYGQTSPVIIKFDLLKADGTIEE